VDKVRRIGHGLRSCKACETEAGALVSYLIEKDWNGGGVWDGKRTRGLRLGVFLVSLLLETYGSGADVLQASVLFGFSHANRTRISPSGENQKKLQISVHGPLPVSGGYGYWGACKDFIPGHSSCDLSSVYPSQALGVLSPFVSLRLVAIALHMSSQTSVCLLSAQF